MEEHHTVRILINPHDDIMTIAEPRWWRYVLLEDVDGVGFVRGFVEGAPQDIIDDTKTTAG